MDESDKFEDRWGAVQNGGEFLAISGKLHWIPKPATLVAPKSGPHPGRESSMMRWSPGAEGVFGHEGPAAVAGAVFMEGLEAGVDGGFVGDVEVGGGWGWLGGFA